MANKLVYVGFGFQHHLGTHAGYHQIKNYLDYDILIDCQNYQDKFLLKNDNLVKKIIRFVRYYLTGHFFIPWYIFRLILLGWRYNNLVYHFIYGENSYFNIKPYIRKGNKIVCTIHQPFDDIVKNKKLDNRLQSVDGIILVGESEVNKFSSRYKAKVIFIPHGICTDFYKPEASIQKTHSVLTVGNWLRDYDFANKVYKKLLEKDDSLEINIVSNPKNFEKIDQSPRIHFYSGISDEKLKFLYCESKALFLPLIRYTANNSLLEAGATGCNIIISSDYPDNSYLPEEMINLQPMDVGKTVNVIYDNLTAEYNCSLVNYVKDNFSWSNIGNATKFFLYGLEKDEFKNKYK